MRAKATYKPLTGFGAGRARRLGTFAVIGLIGLLAAFGGGADGDTDDNPPTTLGASPPATVATATATVTRTEATGRMGRSGHWSSPLARSSGTRVSWSRSPTG